jgi:hypothetical protein
LCGKWPRAKKGKWVEFDCPPGTMAKDVRIVKDNKGPLTLCGVEVYGYKSGSSSAVSMSWELSQESNEQEIVKSTNDTFTDETDEEIVNKTVNTNITMEDSVTDYDITFE